LILLNSQVCLFLFFSLKGIYLNIPTSIKGQLISKGLFAILEFFLKNERNNSIIVLLSKKPRNCSFGFWKNRQLEKKTLLLCLTFSHSFFCFTDLFQLRELTVVRFFDTLIHVSSSKH
jgi:hypothetical protein